MVFRMTLEPFSTCICKTKIPSSHPYCLQNKSCLEFIIEGVSYLFDDNVSRSTVEHFVKQLPITINKKLTKKEPLSILDLDEQTQEKILATKVVPIDFLLPSVVQDFPKNIVALQKHEKMINLGKEIRKRNFSKNLIEKLDRLAIYFAIFFYESRTHPIWRAVLDSVIKAPFTPERLLRSLDTLHRRDATEYIKFYTTLSQNSSLTRITYLIEAMKSKKNIKSDETVDSKTEDEEIMSISKLNSYTHHWFPGIVLTALKHPDIYKTTLEKSYDELYQWESFQQLNEELLSFEFYHLKPDNPQTINPLYRDILMTILSKEKISSKLLAKEVHNTETDIRKTVVLSSNVTISILNELLNDQDEMIRKTAEFKLIILKKEREIMKNNSTADEDKSKNKVILLPNKVKEAFNAFPETHFY